jgi:activating signal cointegrator 1
MKAITLWQPWASLWLTTRKVHETRSWATKYRGELIVHAAKRQITDVEPELEEICLDEFGGHWRMDLPRGAIIGIVQLKDCQSMLEARPIDHDDRICGVWSTDRVAWKRGQFLALARPLPFVGKQGLWNGPDQVLGVGSVPDAAGEHGG